LGRFWLRLRNPESRAYPLNARCGNPKLPLTETLDTFTKQWSIS